MSEPSFSRREFARRLALTTGGAAMTFSHVKAAEDDEAPPAPADALVPEPEDFLLAALLSDYPAEHLTEEMIAGIRADLRNNRLQAQQLRAFPLDNSDAPSTLFRAYRRE